MTMIRKRLHDMTTKPTLPQPTHATGATARFFMDHGMIHDRKTGRHVHTDDSVEPGATADLFKLLLELHDAAEPRETLWIVFSKEGADIVYPARYMAMEQASIMAGEHPDMGPWRVAEYASVAAQQTPLPAERDAALKWYGDRAADLARYANMKPPLSNAIEAVMTELMLDGGKRAAIASQAGEQDQTAPPTKES